MRVEGGDIEYTAERGAVVVRTTGSAAERARIARVVLEQMAARGYAHVGRGRFVRL